MLEKDLCPNCFHSACYVSGGTCSQCGYHEEEARNESALLLGHVLKDRYYVGRLLGSGGFGITYLAYDDKTKKIRAIKEFFPREWVKRVDDHMRVKFLDSDKAEMYHRGLEVFVNEARVLGTMSTDPVIVNVSDFFRENNTAYIVMEYLQGMTLAEYMSKNGRLFDEKQALAILKKIANPLHELHELGMLHRDISPDNVMLINNEIVKLIDFGAIRQYAGYDRKSMSVLVKPGFAPPEQYDNMGKQGPWTDVYALAATYYYLVTGKQPVPAMERLKEDTLVPLHKRNPELSEKISKVIEHAMVLEYQTRLQSMTEFVNELKRAEGIAVPAPYLSMKIGGESRKWKFEADRNIHLGRSSNDCEICVQGPDVSRIHCMVRYDSHKGTFVVADKSANGTFTEYGLIGKGRTATVKPGGKLYLVSKRYELLLEVR